jgi:hypothetical protein
VVLPCLMDGRPRWVRAALVVLTPLLLACEGDSDVADDPPASPYAGVWTATTGQGLPAAVVVGDDGTITDLEMRMQLSYPSGGWCSTLFRAVGPPEIVDGASRFEIRSRSATFPVFVEVRFTPIGVSRVFQSSRSSDAQVVRCRYQRRRESSPPPSAHSCSAAAGARRLA